LYKNLLKLAVNFFYLFFCLIFNIKLFNFYIKIFIFLLIYSYIYIYLFTKKINK
jgi:hypothetical protein